MTALFRGRRADEVAEPELRKALEHEEQLARAGGLLLAIAVKSITDPDGNR